MKISLIASGLVILLSGTAFGQSVEYGQDRMGSDISNFALPASGSPQNCQGACEANGSCVAWTFARSGWQGPTPRCWLKNQAPAAKDSICCVSGTK